MSGQSKRVVYLMRGLPACGKSHGAKRLWTLSRKRDAIAAGISPIVIALSNGPSSETWEFGVCAAENRNAVELAEPDSAWWQELRGEFVQRGCYFFRSLCQPHSNAYIIDC